MSSSQKKFTVEFEAPGTVMDLILGHAGYNETLSSFGMITLFNSIKSQKLARLKDLLTTIVNGNLDETKAMIEKDPSLLVEKLEEKDYVVALSGQQSNNGTAYRTALAVEDTQMAAMIQAKLIEVAGKDVANAQYCEQFPTGWEDDEEKRWAPLFAQLNTLTDVIKDAKQGDITSSGEPEYKLTVREGSAVALALAQFRVLLDEKLRDIVTTGRHFNPQLLLQAFTINDIRHEDFGNDCSDPRAMLFWQQVIGTIQRGLPVPLIQTFCDGIHTTAKKLRNNTPQDRSLKIELLDTESDTWVSSDVYPLSVSRLGFDYAIFGRTRGVGSGEGSWLCVDAFRSFYQSKTACMQTFKPQLQNVRGLSSFCLVM